MPLGTITDSIRHRAYVLGRDAVVVSQLEIAATGADGGIPGDKLRLGQIRVLLIHNRPAAVAVFGLVVGGAVGDYSGLCWRGASSRCSGSSGHGGGSGSFGCCGGGGGAYGHLALVETLGEGGGNRPATPMQTQ